MDNDVKITPRGSSKELVASDKCVDLSSVLWKDKLSYFIMKFC